MTDPTTTDDRRAVAAELQARYNQLFEAFQKSNREKREAKAEVRALRAHAGEAVERYADLEADHRGALNKIAELADELRARGTASDNRDTTAVIDADHLAHQREWSKRTFGPGPRTLGVTEHIRKELAEVLREPFDLTEWVDIIILAFDGAWRAGHEPQAIIDAVKAKQTRNEARVWPDWRTMGDDQAIEHNRDAERTVDADADRTGDDQP